MNLETMFHVTAGIWETLGAYFSLGMWPKILTSNKNLKFTAISCQYTDKILDLKEIMSENVPYKALLFLRACKFSAVHRSFLCSAHSHYNFCSRTAGTFLFWSPKLDLLTAMWIILKIRYNKTITFIPLFKNLLNMTESYWCQYKLEILWACLLR